MTNDKLKKRLKEAGLSLGTLAAAAGMSRQWLYFLIKLESTEFHGLVKKSLEDHKAKVERLINDL